DLPMIKEVGIGGQYLTHPKTFQLCRSEFFIPDLMARKNCETWVREGKQSIDAVAADKVGQRLATYEKPAIDPEIEAALIQYVEDRKTA
ncbi:MAG: trimethylamine methyltransferase family protein, partial [Desulfobacterales bacterium]|nr:trimethylamine methyltransferase family protein [Desulfobacterales bacterium]